MSSAHDGYPVTTPAERALIEAALTWYVLYRFDADDTEWPAFAAAADAALAERDEG